MSDTSWRLTYPVKLTTNLNGSIRASIREIDGLRADGDSIYTAMLTLQDLLDEWLVREIRAGADIPFPGPIDGTFCVTASDDVLECFQAAYSIGE